MLPIAERYLNTETNSLWLQDLPLLCRKTQETFFLATTERSWVVAWPRTCGANNKKIYVRLWTLGRGLDTDKVIQGFPQTIHLFCCRHPITGVGGSCT
jgi:hypothetical protein